MGSCTRQTSNEFPAALKRIEITFDSTVDSPEGDEVEILSILIEKYEDEHYPIGPPDPIEAIKFRMEQLYMNNSDRQRSLDIKAESQRILVKNRKLHYIK